MDSFPDDRATAVLSTLFDKKSELVPAWQGAADLTPGSGLAMLAPETRVYLHPAAAAFIQTRETLYQVSTINSLMTDHYDGLETIDMLKQKGDLGIGTFDGLEGEMVMLDGLVYQVIDTGKVVQPADTILTPFANVTRFERDINLNLGEVKNITDLQATLESMMPRKDAFYAIRVDGTFKHVKVRTVLKQTKPYPAFADVIKNQVVGDYQNVKGTIVGFWSPDYVGGVNLPAYNLHFISDNRSIGGHLIECDITDTRASLDETRNFEMKLNPDGG